MELRKVPCGFLRCIEQASLQQMKKTTVFLYQFFKDMRNALFYSKPADTRSAFAELIAFRGTLEPLLVLVLTRLCILSALSQTVG